VAAIVGLRAPTASSSKEGFSAHQLHREPGCQYNTAWFLLEAMRRGKWRRSLRPTKPISARQKTLHLSPQRKGRPYRTGSRGPKNKRPIIALVERGGKVPRFPPRPRWKKIICSWTARYNRHFHAGKTLYYHLRLISHEPRQIFYDD
jgi:hypothetical protein